MSEQATPAAGDKPPPYSPQRVLAVDERGACGGGAREAPTALPAEGGEGPLEVNELAERSEALR